MATLGIKIRSAIITADRISLRKLIATLDSSQLREQLDNKIDGEDHISLALRLGQRQIALELLLRSLFEKDEWPYSIEEFTWLKLFDFIGDSTITQLQERLKHAKPFAINGDIDLKSLAKNLKYLKVAYLLGAPCQEGKLLGDMILDAYRSKDYTIGRQRVGDLVKSKICRRFPLSVAKTVVWFVSENKYLLGLLKDYPDWFEDTDEHGNNILHHALTKETFSSFSFIWPIRSTAVTTEKLIKLILQKNNEGQTSLVLLLKNRYLYKIPIEFHLAIKNLVEFDDKKTIDEILAIPHLGYKYHRDDETSTKIFLQAFFIQHGYNNDQSRKGLKKLGKIEDFGLFLHHVEKKGNINIAEDETKNAISIPEAPERTIMTRVKNSLSLIKNLAMTSAKNFSPIKTAEPYTPTVSLEDLPSELIFHIAESLPPSDLFTLALCSKQLSDRFKALMSGHEPFWKQYHCSFFRPVPELQTTHREYVCDQFKLRSSWYNNKYSTITLPNDYTPLAMDENWLLMSDESQQYCYWNCHTHEIIESNATKTHPRAEHTILSNYDSNSLPTIFDGRSIIRGSQVTLLNSCKDMKSIMYNKTAPIDHRVLLRLTAPDWTSLVVNTDFDSIEHTLDRWCWYNPFSETFLSYHQTNFQVTDLRSRSTTSKYDTDLTCSDAEFQFADEHTMFYIGYSGAGFVDMRNFKTIYSVALESYRVEKTFSKERAILEADSQLMISWHLPSRKIEWIEPAVSQPTVANSRYLVMGTRSAPSKIVIRDYK